MAHGSFQRNVIIRMLFYYHKLPGGQNMPPVEWELHGGDIGDGAGRRRDSLWR